MKKFKIKLTNWKPFQKQDMWKELIAWKVDASLGYAVKIFSKRALIYSFLTNQERVPEH